MVSSTPAVVARKFHDGGVAAATERDFDLVQRTTPDEVGEDLGDAAAVGGNDQVNGECDR